MSDSSVLLNLLATDSLGNIAVANGWQWAICPVVREESRKLRDPVSDEMVLTDLTPLVSTGVLQVLDLSGEAEQLCYVEQSMLVDDGEAMSIAIAAQRGFELAMDDKQAANHARRSFPRLRLWSTPEIIQQWAAAAKVEPKRLRNALQLIESRARYFPPKAHPLAEWWRRAKESP